MADDSATPGWFQAALAAPCASHTLEVDGCPLNYLAWGDPARPPLVLVHGGLAHANWWTAIAPQLARHYYVVAPDLAGHGDSGRRAAYTLESWAGDVMAVCQATAGGRAPVIVGHSLGGQIAITAAALYGAQLAGVVVVDAPVTRPDPESGALAQRARPLTVYPDLAGAMARFRLLPQQPCQNAYLFDYIARHSLRQVEGGWRWKFDPAVLSRPLPVSLARQCARTGKRARTRTAVCPRAVRRRRQRHRPGLPAPADARMVRRTAAVHAATGANAGAASDAGAGDRRRAATRQQPGKRSSPYPRRTRRLRRQRAAGRRAPRCKPQHCMAPPARAGRELKSLL